MRLTLGATVFLLCLAMWQPNATVGSALAASSLPAVELSAGSHGPREIEDLTRQKVVHDYAAAWQALALGLEQNRAQLLNDYFTGVAKDEYIRTIREQIGTGIHRNYVDHGHKVEVLFYSPDGGVMQLQDDLQYDVQIYDGAKLLRSERTTARFLVLMTPAADRWMVRLLQNVPASRLTP